MVLPSLADSILVIVLVIPGFISFYIFRQIAAIGKDYSEFELGIWSLFCTVFVLLPFAMITHLDDFDKIRDGFLQPMNLTILIGITLIEGFGAGFVAKKFRRNHILGDPWEIAVRNYSKGGSWVIVITKNGDEYSGAYQLAGIADDRREIIITQPKKILRDQNGKVIDEFDFGKVLLFTQDDIARVTFFSDWIK